MFVQSKSTTFAKQKNGVALEQRRGKTETLVQWENGDQRWVQTNDLAGQIRLINESGLSYEQ
tara:strand:+ start:272 stop:457 length:186 start_codon:yes stop_codon:yes gene_type:complete